MQLKSQSELTRAWPETWTMPTVVVRCTVYNHEKFIERCLQGFLMQETDFPFEVVVYDDASTDGSAAIIRRYEKDYPLVLKPVYGAENQWRKSGEAWTHATLDPVLQRAPSYIAMCEGDDYWTDPKKLQKQVEYMESHPGCAGCYHDRAICDETGRILEATTWFDEWKRPLAWDDIVTYDIPIPPTPTVMWRREVLASRPEWMAKENGGDFMTAVWATHAHGTADWVEGISPSVYRIHRGGVYRRRNVPRRMLFDHRNRQIVFDHFPVEDSIRQRIHDKWEQDVFDAWVQWHGDKSKNEGQSLLELERWCVAAWPPLRRRLRRRKAAYRWQQVRMRMRNGLALVLKKVLPAGLYSRLWKLYVRVYWLIWRKR